MFNLAVLKSYWLMIHVSIITASYGFFALGAMLGLIALFLIIFTNFYEILPYRYIPLIVFFSIGIGMFFSKKPNS